MSQPPQAENMMNVSEARSDLYGLVKSAEDDGITTLIHKHKERVLLAPLDRFPAARKAGTFPTWTLSAAQKDLGTLISRAASGEPQVLRRNSTPVAVLLPADPNSIALSSDTAAHPGAAPAGGAVNSQPTPTRERGRRLATLGDAIGDVLSSGSAPGLSFGLAGLDEATGGLHPGRLVLVAAEPQVGGSLIGLAAARTALARNARVLYAASGPSSADITRRIIAAEADGDYARLKTGMLTPHEQDVVERLRHAPLLIDDGSDLTAEAIADTAPLADNLALVVVDRLQRARNPRLPLSGEHLPEASQILRELARTQQVPVIAVLDTDDPAIVNLLDADVILTLTTAPGQQVTTVTVAERDLGIIASTQLWPDLAHARFLDITPAPPGTTTPEAGSGLPDSVGTAADRELADAALPFTSGAVKGLAAEAAHLLAALRTALAGGHVKDLDELHTQLKAMAAAGVQTPDSTEGRRLTAALHAYNAPVPAAALTQSLAEATVNGTPSAGVDTDAEDDDEDADDDDGLAPGDEEDEPEGAVFPGLKILKDAVKRSKMHPIPVIRAEDRDSGPWPLISEDMSGEPKWVHPDVTSTRVAHIRDNGKRVRRDKFDVPASFGDGLMCLIDRNGSFPSACSAVPLAPNKLLHTGPLDAFDKSQAGIYLIDIPDWNFPGMPHPLGRLIDQPDDKGRVWVTTSHIKQLERLHREGHLTKRVTIHDSWTGRANESLFKPFYTAAREARTELVQVGGESYANYKTRVSIALRLLWPKSEEQRSPFWRPDWRMSMVAEASVRHWTVAFKAVQEGHTLIALRKVDAAIFWTPDQTPPDTYRIGTGFGEVKAKFIQPGTFIPEGDD
ncbi:type II toxin-antitoxin system prevent-host-death family antitoxin [Streptomyces rhizosphaerihabitans]|uniref:type II toxin-antitoxin system prevent-host-death family antitoxin n=1 Tax=Streptomyces rhizosphaerihabitans TaxID=1266770 RepID=UPI0021BE60CF|nr:type II toxin-antitoxin system prevent-host-death family antitoxin [Streptomyces rhizosphaerihabitans]MCT9010562.1 type II toxin-antitoxin system prevent-host-death family antitoxin [Streptomyces rhizosphaerihabitans]